MTKRPSFQFYPADWKNDAALRMCSLASRGLWFEMICVMHGAEDYGHLVAGGKAIQPEELARIVGESARDVRKWLAELDRHKIYSVTTEGVIYCRRMVRDEQERQGWRDRQGKHRAKSPAVTDGVTHESRRSSSSPSSSPSKESLLNGHTTEFEVFWDAYPLHVARRQAETSFAQALKRADAALIADGARHYAQSRKDQDPKFTKHPHKWLDADGWLDGAVERLTPERDAETRDKADRLLKRGKYADPVT